MKVEKHFFRISSLTISDASYMFKRSTLVLVSYPIGDKTCHPFLVSTKYAFWPEDSSKFIRNNLFISTLSLGIKCLPFVSNIKTVHVNILQTSKKYLLIKIFSFDICKFHHSWSCCKKVWIFAHSLYFREIVFCSSQTLQLLEYKFNI